MLQKTRIRLSSSMPMDDNLQSNKISYPRLDYSAKEPDMERAKVRYLDILFCWLVVDVE